MVTGDPFFHLEGEGRVLHTEALSYLTLSPQRSMGDLGTSWRQREIEDFVQNRQTDLHTGAIDAVDTLEVTAAAWAAVELGYAACRALDPRGRILAENISVLEEHVSLGHQLFTSIMLRGTKTDISADENLYRAALSRQSLVFAVPRLEREIRRSYIWNHYTETLAQLGKTQARLTQKRAVDPYGQAAKTLTGVWGEAFIQAVLTRPTEGFVPNGFTPEGLLVAPTSTRQNNAIRSDPISSNFDLIVWDRSRRQEQLCLATLPDARVQVKQLASGFDERPYENSITRITVVDDVIQSNDATVFARAVRLLWKEARSKGEWLKPSEQEQLATWSERAKACLPQAA